MSAQHGDVAEGPGWRLVCGRWQTALADVAECAAVVTDPPYSERTHSAYGSVDGAKRLDGEPGDNRARLAIGLSPTRRALDYAALTADDLIEMVGHWSPRATGWTCWLTSHDLVPTYDAALSDRGRYVFAPLPCVISGMTVRLVGDGPSSESVSLVVARPRTSAMAKWGTLPGHYYGPSERCLVVGGKPLWLMRAIIRDYTRPGDLVVDPCAGGGTTLLAAVMEGRRAIGAECDPKTWEKAVARLRKGFTAPLPGMEAPRMEQTGLVFPEAPKRVKVEPSPEALRALHEGGQEWIDSLAYADDGCGWCGDANCEGGCPDNPHNLEACS